MTSDTRTPAVHGDELTDRAQVQQVLDEWVFCRDNGEWPALRRLFATNGRMTTNVGSFTADQFIDYAQAGRQQGLLSHHIPGPSRIQLAGRRAFAETQATLNIRTVVHDTEVDIMALVRYLDRLVVEDGSWRLLDRLPVYLVDRMQVTRLDTRLTLRGDLLERCPAGARFLVYRQLAAGQPLPDPLPVTFNTPESDALFAGCASWLRAETDA